MRDFRGPIQRKTQVLGVAGGLTSSQLIIALDFLKAQGKKSPYGSNTSEIAETSILIADPAIILRWRTIEL